MLQRSESEVCSQRHNWTHSHLWKQFTKTTNDCRQRFMRCFIDSTKDLETLIVNLRAVLWMCSGMGVSIVQKCFEGKNVCETLRRELSTWPLVDYLIEASTIHSTCANCKTSFDSPSNEALSACTFQFSLLLSIVNPREMSEMSKIYSGKRVRGKVDPIRSTWKRRNLGTARIEISRQMLLLIKNKIADGCVGGVFIMKDLAALPKAAEPVGDVRANIRRIFSRRPNYRTAANPFVEITTRF